MAQKKDVFLSTLYRLVTSYSAFRSEEPKQHIITVCNGSGCHVKGGGKILKEVEAKIAENGVNITLEKVRCLGCCEISPAVIIDGDVYSGADAQSKISELLSE